MNDTLLTALGAAMVALWLHGIWEYIQMVRHRQPGTSAFSVTWAPDRLTAEGLRHRRRVLLSWASIAVLLLAALLIGSVEHRDGVAGMPGDPARHAAKNFTATS